MVTQSQTKMRYELISHETDQFRILDTRSGHVMLVGFAFPREQAEGTVDKMNGLAFPAPLPLCNYRVYPVWG